MYQKFKALFTGALMIVSLGVITSSAISAGHSEWKVNTEGSTVYFGSIKKDRFGEVHLFSGISGSIAKDGTVSIDIDLKTIDTNQKSRDSRMIKHVFKSDLVAKLSAKVNMDDVNAIAVGETGTVPVEGTLTLGGVSVPITTNFFLVHLSDTKVIASTQSMIMLSTARMEMTAGIDKLMELAHLPSIARVSPVTIRLVFEK